MSHKTKIESVSDAIESLHFTGFEKGQLLFRGQVDCQWQITTSLSRIVDSPKQASLYESATIMLILMQSEVPFSHSHDPIEHLMNAQYFGVPTRLLDWSYDILVALFFACFDKYAE